MIKDKKSEEKMIKLEGMPASIVGEKIVFDESINFEPITILEYLHSQYVSYLPKFKSTDNDMIVIEKIAKEIYGNDLDKIIEAYDKKMLAEIYYKCYGS